MQGSFIVPVAHELHAPLAATVMAVAVGEGTADMIQPMWALPLLAITGVSLSALMRYTLVSFTVMVLVFGLSLFILTPNV